jgi:hypothetical protein
MISLAYEILPCPQCCLNAIAQFQQRGALSAFTEINHDYPRVKIQNTAIAQPEWLEKTKG